MDLGDSTLDAVNHPPMSMVLLSYNNAPYLKQALEGAFAQTYDPLQIILADDCSTDGSYEILKAAADAYRGPHEVLLYRNPKNLGIAGNLNRAAELATGTLITLAAGDDISDPRRVEFVAAEFARDQSVRAVVTGYTMINERGDVVREVILPRDFSAFIRWDSLGKNGGYLEIGAAFTYHRDCFFKPGPIPPEIRCEDCILPMRALALGKILHRPESLVYYRRHGASATTLGTFDSRPYGELQQRILIGELDWMRANELISAREHLRSRVGIARFLTYLALSRRFKSGSLAGRVFTALYHYERTMRRIAVRFTERRWLSGA